ncbi:DUF1120 domain-containing protein [Pseudomonas sp. Ant30-3]|uniref:DUF1120 domain-containing protein n=1 Tax=Pseudomonas sp. Ant30-3 TaxID=1488328 RepID=UPI00048F874F|nr:DUF1120 domain-containing protein [Pseudomonas sp. Ant30-3]
MKKTLTAFATTVLLGAMPLAWAASSTDLTVTGTITPTACTPLLSNGGVVDYGKIAAKDLNETTNTIIGRDTLQLTVNCVAPVQFALAPVDNNPGTASNGDWWGLGLTNAAERLGFIVTTMSNTLADGQPAQTIISTNNGSTWHAHHHMRPGRLLSVASSADPTTPLAAQDTGIDLLVTTHIAPTNGLTLIDDVVINGSVTFEMKYL